MGIGVKLRNRLYDLFCHKLMFKSHKNLAMNAATCQLDHFCDVTSVTSIPGIRARYAMSQPFSAWLHAVELKFKVNKRFCYILVFIDQLYETCE